MEIFLGVGKWFEGLAFFYYFSVLSRCYWCFSSSLLAKGATLVNLREEVGWPFQLGHFDILFL